MNTTRNISQLVQGDIVLHKGQERTVKAVVGLSRTTNVYFEDGSEWFAVSTTEATVVIDLRPEDKRIWSATKAWFNSLNTGVRWENLTATERDDVRAEFLELGQ